jgi:adenosylcobinamide-GDP ribazoletransferase
MQRLRNTFDDLWAALIFFTRLPWWRLHEVGADHFRKAAQYWPFAGWLTGGAMAATFCFASQELPFATSMLLALGMRLLLTGALHEDGLADFCDGMGGGRDRQHTLSIMKDSHIGTFGVLGLIFYFLGMYNILPGIAEDFARLNNEPQDVIPKVCALLLAADVWGKCCAALLTAQLPYARKEEEAKARVVYLPMQWGGQALRTILAMAPIAALWVWFGWMPHPLALIVPLLTELLLMLWMRRRLGGYTGDCCGATFLLCEAGIYLTTTLLSH